MSRRGIPFVVAAPSGTGKTTVCRHLVGSDAALEFSVSHTTRTPREGERDGHDYHFVTRDEFERLRGQGAFLESAEYNGNLYGTSQQAIDEPLARGHDVILEIEIQGAAQVRARRSDARFVFLMPPSMQALVERLQGRGTDSEEVIARRLRWAQEKELGAADAFDYAVVNDDLETCVADLRRIVDAERAGEPEDLRRRFAPEAALQRFRE